MATGDEQATPISPGSDGTPVPAGTAVIRLGPKPPLKNLNDPGHAKLALGQAWEGLFAFSESERKLASPRLSVWLTALTTPAQAWLLVGANWKNVILVNLRVDQVRIVFAPGTASTPETPRLDVVWEQATTVDSNDPLQRISETRPGCQGHCGIDGLYRGTKAQRGKLRELLTDTVQPGDLVVLTDEQIAQFQAAVTSA
jgi:hypothetical protein